MEIWFFIPSTYTPLHIYITFPITFNTPTTYNMFNKKKIEEKTYIAGVIPYSQGAFIPKKAQKASNDIYKYNPPLIHTISDIVNKPTYCWCLRVKCNQITTKCNIFRF